MLSGRNKLPTCHRHPGRHETDLRKINMATPASTEFMLDTIQNNDTYVRYWYIDSDI